MNTKLDFKNIFYYYMNLTFLIVLIFITSIFLSQILNKNVNILVTGIILLFLGLNEAYINNKLNEDYENIDVSRQFIYDMQRDKQKYDRQLENIGNFQSKIDELRYDLLDFNFSNQK